MGDWQKIIYAVLMLFIAWMLYRNIRNHPEWFTKANLNKSAYTMGVLALLLIGFIAFLVMMLR